MVASLDRCFVGWCGAIIQNKGGEHRLAGLTDQELDYGEPHRVIPSAVFGARNPACLTCRDFSSKTPQNDRRLLIGMASGCWVITVAFAQRVVNGGRLRHNGASWRGWLAAPHLSHFIKHNPQMTQINIDFFLIRVHPC
jgi:hypothetical protein